jgi:hypothetical protein
MSTAKLLCKVTNGRLEDNTGVVKALKQYEGKEIVITIKQKQKTRSSYQNAYYWAVIIPMTVKALYNEWGETWTPEKAHELYKYKFMQEFRQVKDKIIQVPKSTTENKTTEQEVFHDNCRNFLKEYFNVDVPLPNENISFES